MTAPPTLEVTPCRQMQVVAQRCADREALVEVAAESRRRCRFGEAWAASEQLATGFRQRGC